MRDGQALRLRLAPVGLTCSALLTTMLVIALLPGVAWGAGPLVWSASRLVDHSPYRYGRPGSLVGVSCVSGPLCVAVDDHGAVVTSIHPTGGTGAWTLADVDGTQAFSGVSCASASLCVAVERSGSIAVSTDPTGGSGAWTVSRAVDSHPLTAVSCAPTGSLCVAVDPAGDVVTSSDPAGGAGTWRVAHVDNDPNGLVEVSCPSAALCVAVSSQHDVGSQDDVVTSTDPTGGPSAWSRSAESGKGLTAVSCPAASLCVGVDGNGGVATTTAPARGGAWARKQVEPTDCTGPHECAPAALAGVSCPSASFCAAFSVGGDPLTSTDPAGGARAWRPAAAGYASDAASAGGVDAALSCALPSLCAYIEVNGEGTVTGAGTGDGTVVASTNPSVPDDLWHAAQIEGVTPFDDVSCPSASLCVAADFNGDVVSSTDPASTNGAWNPVHIEPIRSIEHVSCRSAALCVAVDDRGGVLTSSHPTGGPHAWHRVRRLGGLQITGVSCPSTSLCVAVGVGNNNHRSYVATSTHPARTGTWIVRPVPQLPEGAVSCPSVSFCAVVGSGHRGFGESATSADPRGGARTWRSVPLHGGRSVRYVVSCPSVSLCVAVDGSGSAFTSTHPRGRRPWRRTRLGPTRESFTALSCPSVHLCVASDDLGNIRSTAHPTGGQGAWTSTHVEGGCAGTPNHGDCVQGVSCPSTALCVAVDLFGDVLLGTHDPRRGHHAARAPDLRWGPLGSSSDTTSTPSHLAGGLAQSARPLDWQR